jgi:DNA-binding NtrC family response regulator
MVADAGTTLDLARDTWSEGSAAVWTPRLMLAWSHDGAARGGFLPLQSRVTVVGRGTPFGGRPLLDPRMSREHLRIEPRGAAAVATDLGSRNGSFVNGRPLLGNGVLRHGDAIRVGDTTLVLVGTPGDDSARQGFLGISAAACAVRRGLRRVAEHPATVLLTGPTGAGKEVAAQTLHALSGRPGAFVAVNCGAIGEHLLESQLFGHVRGAFTGASDAHDGLFRSAHQGTLLLDEVGELPPELQVKLLRVLETGQVRPVGANAPVTVDTRVVAATNADLVSAVRDGRFRSDLYARLAQWPLAIPPLRERREDIPLLVAGVLDDLGQPDRGVAPGLAETLLIHPWPLNVRGLVNIVRMAAIASPADGPLRLQPEIRRALLDARAIVDGPAPEPPRKQPDTKPASHRPMPPDDLVRAALTTHRGSVSAAARELSLSRQQLYRWLQSNGVELDEFREG